VEPDTYAPVVSVRRSSISSSSNVLQLEDVAMSGGESVLVLGFGESIEVPSACGASGCQLHFYRMPDGTKVSSISSHVSSSSIRRVFVGSSVNDVI